MGVPLGCREHPGDTEAVSTPSPTADTGADTALGLTEWAEAGLRP